MMHVLPVAAEYRHGVTWCVLNDRALGLIRDIQEFGMSNRIIDTDFGVQPDFAKIAEACGCYGEQVVDPNAVDGAIARALAANERGIPAVLDFIVARADAADLRALHLLRQKLSGAAQAESFMEGMI